MKTIFLRILALLLIISTAFVTASCVNNGSVESTTEPVSMEGQSREETTGAEETSGKEEQPPQTDRAKPLMWRVTDGDGHTLYLFGTIHVGDNRSDAVMNNVSATLEKCDALAVEFDVVAYAGNMQQMMNDMMQYVLTDGSVVSDYMPEELYKKSYELLERAGSMPALFTHYNLAWWTQMVQSALVTVYSELDPEKAMDSMLIRHANAKGIPVLEVESSEFQMTMLNSFENELYLLQIKEALENTETYGDELNELYKLWLSGDKDALWSYISSEDGDPGDYTDEQIAMIENYNRKMLDDRNLGMRDRAVEYLKSGKTVFFAVGAAHMANGVGLVQLLADAGYTVETVSY